MWMVFKVHNQDGRNLLRTVILVVYHFELELELILHTRDTNWFSEFR